VVEVPWSVPFWGLSYAKPPGSSQTTTRLSSIVSPHRWPLSPTKPPPPARCFCPVFVWSSSSGLVTAFCLISAARPLNCTLSRQAPSSAPRLQLLHRPLIRVPLPPSPVSQSSPYCCSLSASVHHQRPTPVALFCSPSTVHRLSPPHHCP
jgi:hypothetical protein